MIVNKILISLLLTLFVSNSTRSCEEKMEEITFAMIKPDVIQAKHSGNIITLIEQNDFEIMRMEKKYLTKEQAESFYAIHKNKPFFKELISFITSGPVIIMALKKKNAIKDWRELMGATNPTQAKKGTIRQLFGKTITLNAVHGSDSPQTADQELTFFSFVKY